MRGLLKAGVLLAPAIAGAVALEEDSIPSAFITLHLPGSDDLAASQDVVFRFDIHESNDACGYGNVTINGQSLPEGGSGSFTVDENRVMDATWNLTCVTWNDMPQEQLLSLNVGSINGQLVEDVGFTVRFQQVAPVWISDVEGTASMTRIHSSNQAKPDCDDNELDVEAELAELDYLRWQVAELEQHIIAKERRIAHALGWPQRTRPPMIEECDSLKCVFNALVHKVKGATWSIYGGEDSPGFPGPKHHGGPGHHGGPEQHHGGRPDAQHFPKHPNGGHHGHGNHTLNGTHPHPHPHPHPPHFAHPPPFCKCAPPSFPGHHEPPSHHGMPHPPPPGPMHGHHEMESEEGFPHPGPGHHGPGSHGPDSMHHHMPPPPEEHNPWDDDNDETVPEADVKGSPAEFTEAELRRDFEHGPHHDGPHHDGPPHEDFDNEGPHHDGPHHDGPPHEDFDNEGPHHDGPHHDGPPHEDFDNEGPHHDGPPHEDFDNEGPHPPHMHDGPESFDDGMHPPFDGPDGHMSPHHGGRPGPHPPIFIHIASAIASLILLGVFISVLHQRYVRRNSVIYMSSHPRRRGYSSAPWYKKLCFGPHYTEIAEEEKEAMLRDCDSDCNSVEGDEDVVARDISQFRTASDVVSEMVVVEEGRMMMTHSRNNSEFGQMQMPQGHMQQAYMPTNALPMPMITSIPAHAAAMFPDLHHDNDVMEELPAYQEADSNDDDDASELASSLAADGYRPGCSGSYTPSVSGSQGASDILGDTKN